MERVLGLCVLSSRQTLVAGLCTSTQPSLEGEADSLIMIAGELLHAINFHPTACSVVYLCKCSAVHYSAVQCKAMCAVQCSVKLCVQCSAVQCNTVRYSAIQCGTVQCSAVQDSAV